MTLLEQKLILATIAKIDSKKELNENKGFTINAHEIKSEGHRAPSFPEVKAAVNLLSERWIKLSCTDNNEDLMRWIYRKQFNKKTASVTLYFSPEIIPYLSQLKSNFTKYKFEWVNNFSNQYSIRIYELLVQWMIKGEVEFELDKLKSILDLVEMYPRTNNFIQRVIKPSIEEINKHSNIEATFQTKKIGKTISHIQFKFHLKNSQKSKSLPENPKKIIRQKPVNVNLDEMDDFIRQNPVLTKGKTAQEVINLMKNNNK